MTGRTVAVLLLVLALAAPAAHGQAQEDRALYMTADTGDAAGQTGVRLLSPDAPSGEAATETFSPAAGQASSFSWYTAAPWPDDLLVTDNATVVLFFGAGLDAQGTTTATLVAVGNGTEQQVGSATATGVAGGAPHSTPLTLDTAGAVLPEGTWLRLDVSVTGTAVAVNLMFGGDGAESGITSLPTALLDTDGDGAGDSAERRAGSDPTDASSTPTNPGGPGTGGEGGDDQGAGGDGTGTDPEAGASGGTGSSGSDSDTSAEAVVGAALLLFCLAVGGFALLRRFPA